MHVVILQSEAGPEEAGNLVAEFNFMYPKHEYIHLNNHGDCNKDKLCLYFSQPSSPQTGPPGGVYGLEAEMSRYSKKIYTSGHQF